MPFPININDDCLMTTKKTMTTNAGTPVAENQNVQTAGPHGPMLMQNVWYMKNWPILRANAFRSGSCMRKVRPLTGPLP